jgi:two-component system, sensor histidine kinase YesM
MRPAITSIRTRLLLSFLALLAIPVLTLGVIGPYFFSSSIEKQAIDHTLRMIAQVEKNLEYHIRGIEKLILLIEEQPSVQAFLRGGPADGALVFFDQCLATHPEISGILLVNADDRVLTAHFDRITRTPLTEEAWYQRAMLQPQGITIVARPIGRNIRSRFNLGADDVVSVVKPLLSKDDREDMRGAILIDLRREYIEDVLADSSLGRDGYLYISDAEGELVNAPINKSVYRIAPRSLKGPSGRTIRQVDDELYQVLYKRSDYLGWTTAGVFSLKGTLREVSFVRLYSLIIGGITIALAVVLSVVFSSSIARPVIHLQGLMKRAETGDFEAYFEDPQDDEIGQLGKSFNAMIEEIRNLINQVYQEQQRKREAELRVLQEQIKPHFLYNTLDTIQWMAQEHDAQDIVCVVGALTSLFRIGLSKGHEIIPVGDEIHHVESYLCIQKARYEDKFEYHIDVEAGLEKYFVLKLVLQPLAENALYHGIKERRGSGRIDVRARVDAGDLLFEIQDDGLGMTQEGLDLLRGNLAACGRGDRESISAAGLPNGFGACNVHERIQLTFGLKYGLEYESAPEKGTTVRLRHPLLTEAP